MRLPRELRERRQVARHASIPYLIVIDTGSWRHVLTAENLITGSPADDDVAMGGHHAGIPPAKWKWVALLLPPGHRRRVARW
jgi:hypothetical protein